MATRLSAEILKIPLAQLVPSPFNVRSVRPEARIKELARSLEAEGQREPITVYSGTKEDGGKYWIISGVTRYLAASRLRWETLDARVDATLDSADAPTLIKMSRLHNSTCRETELDHAFAARALREKKLTWEKISEALGYSSERNTRRLNAFFKLPERILAVGLTMPEKFSASAAELLLRAIASIGEERTLALLERVAAEKNHPISEIERRIRTSIAHASSRGRRTYTRKVFHGDQSVGTFSVSTLPDRKKKILLAMAIDEHLEEEFSPRLTQLLKEFEENV
ncbi:MAG: ParB/RepB/Spo0J family partition protein [Azoarcus sp.]|nr:ParB/RepB/Spo0J family partition protein [Azoarcus sp.]